VVSGEGIDTSFVTLVDAIAYPTTTDAIGGGDLIQSHRRKPDAAHLLSHYGRVLGDGRVLRAQPSHYYGGRAAPTAAPASPNST
jgi:hypothetical protein